MFPQWRILAAALCLAGCTQTPPIPKPAPAPARTSAVVSPSAVPKPTVKVFTPQEIRAAVQEQYDLVDKTFHYRDINYALSTYADKYVEDGKTKTKDELRKELNSNFDHLLTVENEVGALDVHMRYKILKLTPLTPTRVVVKYDSLQSDEAEELRFEREYTGTDSWELNSENEWKLCESKDCNWIRYQRFVNGKMVENMSMEEK